MRDYYKILGVERNATQDQIKKAFRELAKKFHPDVNKAAGAEARFKEINEAYAVLSDPEKKKQYDTFGAEGFSQRFSQEDIFRNFDFQSVFSDLFGGMGGGDDILSRIFGMGGGRRGSGKKRGGRSSGPDFQGFSFEGNPFGGAQGGPFGGAQGGNPFAGGSPFGGAQGRPFGGAQGRPFGGGSCADGSCGQQRSNDVEAELTITLDEAMAGGKRRVSLEGGGGAARALEITIPAGVRDGQRLRLAGKGNPGGGGQAGDLLLRIRVAPHPLFRIEGDDLVTEIDVPLTTLVLGGSVEVPTPDGPRRRLKIKEGTPNRARMRVREQGLPVKGGPRGDLYVLLHAFLPEHPTDEQKKLFEKLRELGG
ncbi:MAG: J domain-containing protein [Deltaproteobacteria bacterium]|nr:J domain-containing protein [Deltaproteobacteria bacterium]